MRELEELTLRAGSPVRAPDDAAHTERGFVVALSYHAPVALVRFHCGCRAYVPIRRLEADRGPAPARCEVSGCQHPRWGGPYCASHPDGAPRMDESFESQAKRAISPSSAASEGAVIDDRSTTRDATDLRVEGRPPADVTPDRHPGGESPSPALTPSEPKAPGAAGGARWGAPRKQSPAPHKPPERRSRWTDELVLARLREWLITYGEAPSVSDWNPTVARKLGRTDAAERFEAADGHWPTSGVVRSIFLTWGAFLRRAELTPQRGGPRRRAA